MLRRMGLKVYAVDNLQSEYRTLWISDTITRDGESYLQSEKGAQDAMLLLVYPIVGFDFTSKILKAYKGGTICVAGTQNRNGYTAFKDRTIGEYVMAEKPDPKPQISCTTSNNCKITHQEDVPGKPQVGDYSVSGASDSKLS